MDFSNLDKRQMQDLESLPSSASPSRAPTRSSRTSGTSSHAPASPSRAPTRSSRTSGTSSHAPASPSRAPATSSCTSAASSCAPATRAPAISSRAPASPSHAPFRSSRVPTRSSHAPATSSRTSAGSSRAPATSSLAPARLSRAPARSSRTSGISSSVPASPSRAPGTSSCTSAGSSRAPATRAPAISSRAPASPSHAPFRSSRVPTRSSHAPATSSRTSADSSRAPATSSRAPADSSRAPATSSRAPASLSHAIASTSSAPTFSLSYPPTGSPSYSPPSKRDNRELSLRNESERASVSLPSQSREWSAAKSGDARGRKRHSNNQSVNHSAKRPRSSPNVKTENPRKSSPGQSSTRHQGERRGRTIEYGKPHVESRKRKSDANGCYDTRDVKRRGNTNRADDRDLREGNVVKPISFTALKKICDITENDEAMLEISKMAERYIALLNSKEEIREELFMLIIDSLVKILKSKNRPTQVKYILCQTHQEFLVTHLTPFILTLSDNKDQNFEELILKLVTIIEVMLQRIPAEIVYSVPIFQLHGVVEQFHKEGLVKDHVNDRIKKTKALWGDVKERIANKGKNENPPNDFRELHVVPDYKDFQPETKPFIRANVIDKAYISVEHYLDVQFRLLREDLIIPLRDGVKQLRKEKTMLEKGSQGDRKTTKKRREVFVYQDVKILNPVCNREGGVYRICIDISHPALQRVQWKKSKRLKFGALVCVSPDSFHTLYFGSVEERDPADLNYGELQIRFDNCNGQQMRYFIENKTSFQMVESDSYFEAYRHNLSALQKLTDENLPFKDYIVFGNKDVLPPKYLLENAEEPKEPNEEEGDRGKVAHEESLSTVKETENAKDDDELSEGELDPATVYFDLKIICDPKYPEDCDQNMSSVPVLELDQWPSKEVLGLDESQYRACQLALTKRFALIQGPPGTGKTYVGLKIAHALLDNRDLWSGENRSPILMVSYTNHALDQFLMGLNNKQGIVRVGSRSRVEELYNYNLKLLRKRKHHDEDVDLLYLREKDGIRRKIMEIESKYLPKEAASLLAQSNKAVISLKGLKKFIEFEHFKALKPFEQCSYVQMDEELLRWLDIEIRPAKNRARKEEDKQFLKEIQRMSSFRESIDEDIEVIDTENGKFFPACYIDDAVEPNKLRDSLENSHIMDERREIAIDDIWQLRLDERWRLYQLWRDRLQDDCQKRIIDSQDAGYETELKKLQESNADVDLKIFRNSRVIGMTTSCAAKYHSLLQRVKPKVVIVEEAAEVLEAHILTSLPLDCEHVILIGDHQQLRPSCTVYELAKKYNLNISMFERLVKLQMPCVRLSEQHRMRPEIASLMKHIYKDLQDHPSVKEYDNMRGVEHNVFFIDHRHHEDSSEDSFSHLNEHEAQFLVRLCRYFVQQGYEPSQITILTPYLGQMFMIRDNMTEGDDDLRKQTRLTTIDNYQGEENDIILLSLVRSNDTGHVGFVNDINRACVALSRARMGLYVIGNFELLISKSDIWKKVVDDLKKRGQFGQELPIKCQSHNSKILLKEPKDFLEKVPYGGCDVPCMCRLRCGHSCKLSCHPFDKEHVEFKCLEQCARTIRGCENGHLCEKECWEPCDFDCNYPVDKILRCGHTKKNARCSVNIQRLECDVRCEKKLKCGHQCQAKCGKSCTKACQELEKRNDWPCGHEVTVACSATPFDCPGPCGNPICDHICSGSCGECLQGRVHRRCMKTCGRVLVCGHECRDKCTSTCPPCTKKCETKCKHSECRRKCGEPCVSCTDQCEWKCEHFQCSKRCGEICDRPRCDEPCRKLLQCKHRCRGLCNEPCICVECKQEEIPIFFGTEDFDDETVRFIQLRGCEHIFEVRALDHWMDMGNDDQTEQNSIQPKVCPGCKTPIQTMMRYNNVIKKQLKDIERVKGKLFKPLSEERRYKVRKKLTQYLRDASSNSISSSAGRKRRHDEVLLKRIDQARNLFEITNIGNQVELLTRCHTLIKKATETKAKIADEKSAEMKDVDLGISVLKFLEEKRIVGSGEREITDIELELKRQKVVIEICSLLSETESLDISLSSEHKTLLDNIRNSLSKASSNEKPELDSYLKEVEEIRSTYPIAPPTREEKDQIIKAMGLSKGHWYKCRQGHVYAIGECGGAMETGTCPECHDVIGGASHRLAEGNKVATEMDGARHSAWSEQANIGNYDLQE